MQFNHTFQEKYSPLQYQTLRLPKGRFGQRRPDILIKMYSSTIPVEHDGGIHGFNDDISETKKTQDRNDDYIRDGYLPIIINQLQLEEEGITEELFVRCAMILFEPIYRSKQRLQLTK